MVPHRRTPYLRAVLALAGLLTLTLALVLAFVRVSRVVVAPGALVGGSRAVLAPGEGRIAAVHASPGDDLREGQALLELDVEALRSEQREARARLEAARARLTALAAERERAAAIEGPARASRAANDGAQARVALEAAERRAKSLESLRGDGLVAELAFQDAQSERTRARLAVERAELEQRAAQDEGVARLADLDGRLQAQDGEVAALEAGLAELERRVSAASVRAPCDGRLLALGPLDDGGARVPVGVPSELVGRWVRAGDELARLAGAAPRQFEGSVDDLGQAQLRVGQAVKIRLDGFPWLLHGTLPGRVEWVGTRADPALRGRFGVRIAVDAPGAAFAARLAEGMRGEARIETSERVRLGRLLIERATGVRTP